MRPEWCSSTLELLNHKSEQNNATDSSTDGQSDDLTKQRKSEKKDKYHRVSLTGTFLKWMQISDTTQEKQTQT